MSNDSLILDLAANLKPVKPRNILREAMLLLALAGAEAALILGLGAMRPDMGAMVASSYMAWKIGSFALLAGVTCTVAMRSFSPPASPRRGLMLALGLIGATMIGGAFVASAADSGRSLLDRISPVQGMLCVTSIIVLALPLLAMLGVAMRRAAPTHPESSALAAGVAAGSCAALVFTLCCPMNDPLYILVWYCTGCAAIAAFSRWLLPRHFRL
jgi:hypothetical protein